ncbi:hypothetical protein [Amycolatopsis sp. lyj-84]|uniref:hypothetical protein n=1 Tax=Amycolatopsis sp. lyj-84 TaxID=2789284 RepID=UPI00397CB2C5
MTHHHRHPNLDCRAREGRDERQVNAPKGRIRMCRSAAEGGRRCSGSSCGAAAARRRQQLCRARKGLTAAYVGGDPGQIAAAEAKYAAVIGDKPPVPTTAPTPEKPVTEPDKPEPDTSRTATPKTDATKTGTTEDRIRAAFKSLAKQQGDWIRIVRIREAVGGDVTHDEITQVLTDMMRRGDGVHLAPDSNRKVLTEDDHNSAVKIGGEDKHLVAIEPPCIPGAADHIRAVGTANATDEELENGLNAPEVTGALYDEIRAEQRQRKQT